MQARAGNRPINSCDLISANVNQRQGLDVANVRDSRVTEPTTATSLNDHVEQHFVETKWRYSTLRRWPLLRVEYIIGDVTNSVCCGRELRDGGERERNVNVASRARH